MKTSEMTKDQDRDVIFTYHRPISITVMRVELMTSVRDLPQETLMTANLKLGLDVQKRIKELIENNLAKEDPDQMIALTIKGVS